MNVTDKQPDAPGPESLEATMQRLAAYGAAPGAPPRPPAPPAVPPAAWQPAPPPVPPRSSVVLGPVDGSPSGSPSGSSNGAGPSGPAASPSSTSASIPRRGNRTVAIVASIAVVVVLLLGVATWGMLSLLGGTITSADPGSGSGAGSPVVEDEWTDYPGTAYSDSQDVLAAPSKEEAVATAEAISSQFRDALTEEFGLEWTQTWKDNLAPGGNGYGGESMLYDYTSGEWQGTAVVDDPDARERVIEIFTEVVQDNGGSTLLFSNEVYVSDPEASREQFGAEEVDDQPLWTAFASDVLTGKGRASVKAFDTSMPIDDAFTGDVWFDLENVEKDAFVVTIQLADYGLLSEDDVDAFTDRLQGYDEANKPEPR